MEIICLTVGDLATHCYLAIDEETKKTIIIDPGDEGDFISTTLLEQKLLPEAVVFTHGHYDHCLAGLELKLNFALPLYLHPKDLFLYKKAHLSAKHFSHLTIPQLPPIDKFLSDKEIITFGNSSLQVLHTPGHTPGSVCLTNIVPTILFTGDTLFVSGPGAADHSYSSAPELKKSLDKLSDICSLSSNTYIYPGHEETAFLQ